MPVNDLLYFTRRQQPQGSHIESTEFYAMILSVLSTSTPLREISRVNIPKIGTMSSRLVALSQRYRLVIFYLVLARRVSTHAKYFIPRLCTRVLCALASHLVKYKNVYVASSRAASCVLFQPTTARKNPCHEKHSLVMLTPSRPLYDLCNVDLWRSAKGATLHAAIKMSIVSTSSQVYVIQGCDGFYSVIGHQSLSAP